jgi:hypothetical protein
VDIGMDVIPSCGSGLESDGRRSSQCGISATAEANQEDYLMTQSVGQDDLRRIRHNEYVEVIRKDTGGKVEFFECPHCAATFGSFDEAAHLAVTLCAAHARTCSKAPARAVAKIE